MPKSSGKVFLKKNQDGLFLDPRPVHRGLEEKKGKTKALHKNISYRRWKCASTDHQCPVVSVPGTKYVTLSLHDSKRGFYDLIQSNDETVQY